MSIGTCCVTGHRNIPEDKIEFVKQTLTAEIQRAINEGYTHFISGFAEGVDLFFATIVADIKRTNPSIKLEAAIPYRKRLQTLHLDNATRPLLCDCSYISIISENYSHGCFASRNRYMVEESSLVIAVFDGRTSGGTCSAIRTARLLKRSLRIIEV